MRNKLLVVAVCGCAFLGGLAAEVLLRGPGTLSAQNPPLPATPVAADPDKATVAALSERFQTVVKQVGPAVVAVDAVKPPTTTPANGTKAKPEEESGSGVLVKFPGVSGTIAVSNNHVVGAASPDKVFVTLSDGRILRPVRVLADPESDISLLQLDTDDLPTVQFADSEKVRRGQWVLAFGSPFGLNQSVTHGIISATDRGQITLNSTIRIKEFIQTDAAINPGSSGGPLIDLEGRLVGINTAIASKSGSSSGVSFSIPANLVKRVALQLFEKGSVTRGYLGVQLASTLEPAEALRLGLNKVSGALIEIVHPGTPAAAAGLRQGDVLLKLEDVELRDENHLINLVSALPPNQKVRLTVWRGRQAQPVEVVIGDWTASRTRVLRQ
jgi:S1-C subfamily serine protease